MSATFARAALLAALLTAGCRAEDPAEVAGRLWVTELPTSPRQPFAAFATTRQAGAPYLGAFHRGSMYAGQYQVFRWVPDGPGHARVILLQTGDTAAVAWRPCPARRPFDACIELTEGPFGRARFSTRSSWRTAELAVDGPVPQVDLPALLARAHAGEASSDAQRPPEE